MKLSNNPRLNLEINLIKLMRNVEVVENVANYPQEKKKYINNPQPVQDKKIINIEKKENLVKEEPIHDEQYLNSMEKLKNIRVNNTLCNFDKKKYLEAKSMLDAINQYVLNPDYSPCASLLLDGELKAVGGNYYIYMYNSKSDSDIYNENVINIDELLGKVFNDSVHSISVSADEWETIKHDFNNHVREYRYQEETEEYSNFLKKQEESVNSIESSFVELIEYQ